MTPTQSFEPFGMASVSSDLKSAKEFYQRLYPFPADGNTIVSVFEKSPGNPITGMIPVLRVDSVAGALVGLEEAGVKVLIPASICPCTNTHFALCTDPEGNQFIVKEPV
jgi:predicted enzyme related to lactoylglutathione lyase